MADSDQIGRMPRLIWSLLGAHAILPVLSWGGSNSEDPHQTAPSLFAQTCLSKNLESVKIDRKSVFKSSLKTQHSTNKPYRKFPKYSDTQNICCNHSKIWTMWLYQREMNPNDADRMANSVDPDQTAPLGAVWSVGCVEA